jgi:hypothetical protein
MDDLSHGRRTWHSAHGSAVLLVETLMILGCATAGIAPYSPVADGSPSVGSGGGFGGGGASGGW